MTSLYQTFMSKAQNPLVRDLAWMLASPPMIASEHAYFAGQAVTADWCEQHFIKFQKQLHELEAHPEPLIQWVRERSSKRLGRYFESLVGYWLQHAPGVSQVKSSVKVKKGKVTLGEFDFLFVDALDERPVHMEVAVKFYLRHGSGDSWQHFVGPMAQDRLDIKLQHVFERQLRLSDSGEGALALESYGDISRIRRLALIKGYCFDPGGGSEPELAYPSPGLGDQRLRGWWISCEKMEAWVQQRPASLWIILPKLEWLAPSLGLGQNTPQTGQAILVQLLEFFRHPSQPLLLAELRKTSQGFQENSRGFIVPARWPDLETRSE